MFWLSISYISVLHCQYWNINGNISSLFQWTLKKELKNIDHCQLSSHKGSMKAKPVCCYYQTTEELMIWFILFCICCWVFFCILYFYYYHHYYEDRKSKQYTKMLLVLEMISQSPVLPTLCHLKPQDWKKYLSNWVLSSVITGVKCSGCKVPQSLWSACCYCPPTLDCRPHPQTKKFIVICQIKRKGKTEDFSNNNNEGLNWKFWMIWRCRCNLQQKREKI